MRSRLSLIFEKFSNKMWNLATNFRQPLGVALSCGFTQLRCPKFEVLSPHPLVMRTLERQDRRQKIARRGKWEECGWNPRGRCVEKRFQSIQLQLDSSSALLRLIFSDMLQLLPAGNNRLTHWTMGPTCHLCTTPIGHYIPRASKPTYPQAGGV